MQRLIAILLAAIVIELGAIMYMLYPFVHTYLESGYSPYIVRGPGMYPTGGSSGGSGTSGADGGMHGNTGPSVQRGPANIPMGAIGNPTGMPIRNGGSTPGTNINSGPTTGAGVTVTSPGIQNNTANPVVTSPGIQNNSGGSGTVGTAGQCNTMGADFNYRACQKCDPNNPKCPEGTECRPGANTVCLPEGYPRDIPTK